MSLQLPKNKEATPGSRRWFSKTLIAAYVVLGLVLWQTIQVVGGGEMPFGRSVKPQLGSTKLHTDRDTQSRKNRPIKEPLAAFFERAKRGMTEQEIRGMIAEYEAIGPMPISGDLVESRDYAKKLNEWHLKALAEALSLSHEQRREVWDSLNPAPDPKPLEWILIPPDNIDLLGHLRQQNLIQNVSYGGSYADSWRHCNLTDDQVKLTYMKSLEARYLARWEEDKKSGSTRCHGEHLLIMHDPATGEYVDYPSTSIVLGSFMPGTVAGGIIDVTNTFPLTPDQKLADHRNDLLAQAKLLHPAQLRMALLMNSFVGIMLKSELEKPRE